MRAWMPAKETESEAALEQALKAFVAGLDRTVRDYVSARYEASLFKVPEEARKAQQAARESWARDEAHLKAEFDKALRRYLQESSQRTSGEFKRPS
jgi:hypothetical protein